MNSEAHSERRSKRPLMLILTASFVSAVVAATTAMIVVSLRAQPPTDTLGEGDTQDIIVRLERLEERRSRDPDKTDKPAEDVRPVVTIDDSELREIRQRLEQLEQADEAQRTADRERNEQAENIRRMTEVYDYEVAISVMSDPSAEDEEKATAWRSLRHSAEQAWTDEIVMEAVRIGTTATDPWLRADIWRQAHANHTHPLLLQPLLQALSNDPNAGVRSEAAETLDLYLDAPGVRAALSTVGEYDVDASVRRQARSSLDGPDTGF